MKECNDFPSTLYVSVCVICVYLVEMALFYSVKQVSISWHNGLRSKSYCYFQNILYSYIVYWQVDSIFCSVFFLQQNLTNMNDDELKKSTCACRVARTELRRNAFHSSRYLDALPSVPGLQ